MYKSEITYVPAQFLDRFDKFLITQEDIKKATLDAIPKSMNKLVRCAIDKVCNHIIYLTVYGWDIFWDYVV